MLRLLPRRSPDVTYLVRDGARELDGVREGDPGWWLRGAGDPRDPDVVARVLTSSERSRLLGYDVVVAAPRPISVLVALDPVHAPGVVAAHRASVRAAMDYQEDRALVVRDRRGGRDRDEVGRWSGVVAFTHGLNRHGEPHLHDHVLVGARPEAARTVLDSRALYAHARSADALYRASLRYELAERTPWSAWRSFEGVERVAGLDEGYRALWSGHHRERGDKLDWSRDETLARWSLDLTRFEPLGSVVPPVRPRHVLDEHAFAGALEGRHDVARRHVLAAWADAATFGQATGPLARSVDQLYPRLREGRGVHEATIALREARMLAAVRELGPRPLEPRELSQWTQSSRERVLSRGARSR